MPDIAGPDTTQFVAPEELSEVMKGWDEQTVIQNALKTRGTKAILERVIIKGKYFKEYQTFNGIKQ